MASEAPAIVVVDFAYGWTDDAYAGGSRRLDGPVEATAGCSRGAAARSAHHLHDQSLAAAEGRSSRSSRRPTLRRGSGRGTSAPAASTTASRHGRGDLVIEKENASAFFGTHLAPYLIGHGVDTLFITGCSTSACIRATATDAKSYRFRPIIVRDCVGDRSAVAHEWTLFDIQARFADVVRLGEVVEPLPPRRAAGSPGFVSLNTPRPAESINSPWRSLCNSPCNSRSRTGHSHRRRRSLDSERTGCSSGARADPGQ